MIVPLANLWQVLVFESAVGGAAKAYDDHTDDESQGSGKHGHRGRHLARWQPLLRRRAGAEKEPQVCLAVDLFEVIAELAALDLEQSDHAREAIELADAVQTDLARV